MHPSALVKKYIWIAAVALACFIGSATAAGPPDCPPELAGCSPQSAVEERLPQKVALRVAAELKAKGHADVLVFVQGRPDLAPARALRTKPAKGRFVVMALRATAEKTQAGLRQLLDARKVPYQSFWLVNMLRVRGDWALISELGTRPEVTRIDINLPVTSVEPNVRLPRLLDLPQSAYPWGVSWIGAPSVWARGVRGQGIVVAGADTGVDWDHEALKDQYRGWDDGTADHNYNWHDAISENDPQTPPGNPCGFGSPEPCDDHGHGTHTIGTVAGAGAQNIGVAPGARWIACRNMEQGYGTPASYVDCFQFFLAPTDLDGQNPRPDLAAHVINNSWVCIEAEGCHPGDPLWNDTIRPVVEAVTEAGIVVVASAGNAGSECATVRNPPAIYPQSLSVGATQQSGQIASFSSRGPVTIDGSGLPAPDLAAPGVDVLSSFPGNSYGTLSGTSMAGPHVAGTIALLWSAQPQLIGHVSATEQVLRASAVPVIDTTCGGDPAGQPNNVYGWGVIDADAGVDLAQTVVDLRGAVTDLADEPLPGVVVTVTDLTWGVEMNPVTAADGQYGTPLLPGSYRVGADAPAHFAVSQVVTVPAGGPLIHNLQLANCIDVDGDGRSGVMEIQTVADDWQSTTFDPAHDLNRDGVVDVLDVSILAAHFGEPC